MSASENLTLQLLIIFLAKKKETSRFTQIATIKMYRGFAGTTLISIGNNEVDILADHRTVNISVEQRTITQSANNTYNKHMIYHHQSANNTCTLSQLNPVSQNNYMYVIGNASRDNIPPIYNTPPLLGN